MRFETTVPVLGQFATVMFTERAADKERTSRAQSNISGSRKYQKNVIWGGPRKEQCQDCLQTEGFPLRLLPVLKWVLGSIAELSLGVKEVSKNLENLGLCG